MKQTLLPGILEDDLGLDLTKKVNSKHEAAKFLIKKFLKEKPKSWGREIKIAQRVITVHPEILDVNLSFKLNSLAWLLTPDGKTAVNKHLFSVKLDSQPKETYTVGDQKFGEDKVLPAKPKTFKDFLD